MAIAISIFFVSVPVFFEAPLVRALPWLSFLLTGLWFWAGYRLRHHPIFSFWGELLIGFSWSWLAGSLYWGWFRWEPLLHLPIESIGLPFALWGLYQLSSFSINAHPDRPFSVPDSPTPLSAHPSPIAPVGHCFYLGSLLGTAITDAYCYLIDVIPHWRRIMAAPIAQVPLIFQEAVARVETPWGIGVALGLALVLLTLAWVSGRSSHLGAWIVSGTLIGTLLVDCLFIGVATL
ncbi:MAG: DUF3120 domain-containing protein [Prochlorothrix sp.]